VVQLVNSLDLSTDVEVLDGLVQELDGRVLGVTAEDELALLLPKLGETIPRQQRPTKKLEPPAGRSLRNVKQNQEARTPPLRSLERAVNGVCTRS
jgi:hypothetical protein